MTTKSAIVAATSSPVTPQAAATTQTAATSQAAATPQAAATSPATPQAAAITWNSIPVQYRSLFKRS